LKHLEVHPSPDRSATFSQVTSTETVDSLFSRWTELTDLYATQLVMWEHGDLAAFQAALQLAPEIEQLRRLISRDKGEQAPQSGRPSNLRR
jgi:hypothetical protein